jgi:hypothetical protein
VITRLERDVQCCSGNLSGRAERLDLSVGLARHVMEPLAERASIAHDDCTDRRIGGHVGCGPRRELAGAMQVNEIAR